FEAYVEMDEPVTAAGAIGVEAVLEAVESATGVPAAELEGAYTVHSGRRVAEHLFSVASGLESVVSGEGEIAGQVRRALKSARKDGTISDRTLSKIRLGERGMDGAIAQIVGLGLPGPGLREQPETWLRRLQAEGLLTRHRTAGLFTYCFELTRSARRNGRTLPRLPYPKILPQARFQRQALGLST
ncbi:MAG TPA: hypothetical protein VMQ93_11670, partial [Novosphingobium sp.]|nr:hypothetical protein [Novosphingobium sp.]